ncbi:chitin synthase-domain-containing protein [Coemansia spiralis]|nr:chitin synthase-domain-containing protein [Coemansia spiralis]
MGLFGKSQKDKNNEKEMAENANVSTHVPAFEHPNHASREESIVLGAETTVDRVADAAVECFERAVPYIRIYTSILVACHSEPAMSGGLFTDEAAVVYSDACYHDLDFTARDSLDPHIYELVADAYTHMRRLHQDQAIVLSGVSGSGKSETAKLITDQLCVLASNSGRHNTRAQYQMSYAGAVIEAFSSAQTLESFCATRAGLWQEVQFNERGHISGTKVVSFGLDRWRVTNRLPGERTFNVFYYLLHGSTSDERQQWQFRHSGDEAWFSYLKQEKPSKSSKAIVPSPEHNASMMDQLRTALKVCGLKQRQQHAIFQVLAAIMHLGNVEFADAADGGEDAAVVRNQEEIELAAEYLGVSESALTAALCYKTALVNSDLCTVFLNSHGAANQRNALARSLYHLLYYWLIEHLNQTMSDPEAVNHVAVLQMYGFSQLAANGTGSFEQFAFNMANERLQGYVLRDVLSEETGISRQMHDDAASGLNYVAWSGRLHTMHLLLGDYSVKRGGIVGAIEQHASDSEHSDDDIALVNSISRGFGQNPCFIPGPPPNKRDKQVPQFGIRHYFENMMYNVDGFCQHNMDLEVSPDFYTLFKDSSRNGLVRRLFGATQVALDYHPEEESAIVGTFLSTRPASRPTVRKPECAPAELDALDDADPANTFVGEVSAALEDVLAAADHCKLWHVLHIRPDDPTHTSTAHSVINKQYIGQQVQSLGVVEISQRRAPVEFTVAMSFEEFIERYTPVARVNIECDAQSLTAAMLVDQIAASREWIRDQHYTTGHHIVFMTERVWRSIEVELRAYEKQRQMQRRQQRQGGILDALAQVDSDAELMPPHFPFDDGASTIFGSEVDGSDIYDPNEDNQEEEEEEYWSNYDDYEDTHSVATGLEEKRQLDAPAYARQQQPVEEIETTPARRCWSRTTNCLTWIVPDWMMNCCGMKREDIRMAWREKVAICLIIIFMWGFVLFFIIGLGLIMCPKQYVYNMDELSDHTERSDAYIAMRGRVYDITNFLNQEHGKSRGGASPEDMIMYAGQEVNASFPLSLRGACPDLVTTRDDPNWLMYLKSDIEIETSFPFVHKAGSLANSKTMMRQDFYYRSVLPKMKLFKVGDIVWDLKYIKSMHHKGGMYWRVINGEVFNLNPYFLTRDAPENIDQKKWHFLHRLIESIFEDAGARDTDITKYWNMLPITKKVRQANYRCMKNLFYVGKVDTRHSFRCLFPNFLLLAAACLLMLVITIKFLASLQLSSRRKPQKHDKFVVCQVPCYTEGEASLRRTIDSLATLGYDDKHRLLFIICDGNIVGSGNDRPTPRIVLDILGVDPKLDPPGRAFKSIGEGGQQHNVAKVYSGLYEYEGHVVPYLVVAKVGKPTEKSRPGNRGKRDSQMLLLHFLNRVHFEAPMSPLDLEIYHQMKNVIGVHPSLYEYVLMVDADTEVLPDSLTRLVSCMVHDAKVIGICGETMLTNEDFSWTTMIQVYEYFISHHMAKAFESLFGSVTCLPGCFCMYRLRTQRGLPLIISKNVVREYSENHVDTLHKKNLLSLGEDRYLTTLMMKYFPQYKMTFTPDAKCKTTAPDTWSVLLSQRRRWINSTVHNLVELVFLPEMCGFCCFSMRFVVFIDLLGTLTMPCTLFYLVYLAYLAITKMADIGYISLILIGAIYGLQAVIFVLKRQWQHIGWMVIYLLAYPLWSFFIPIYAFWHMDDFSWGNTRIVVGDDGKRQIFVKDEEPFDPEDVPMKTWADYEAEIHERQRQIDEIEAVGQAIDEFGNCEVRPVSRFTHLQMPIAGTPMHPFSMYPQ